MLVRESDESAEAGDGARDIFQRAENRAEER
jgi:hypothetical protein